MSNDHPSSEAFLQLYEILSTFKILNQSSYGNCEIDKQCAPRLVTIKNIKDLCNSNEKNETLLLAQLEQIFKNCIETNEWIKMDTTVLDHNYVSPDLYDTSLIQLSVRICRTIKSKTQCELCKSNLINERKIRNSLVVNDNTICYSLHTFILQLEKLFNLYSNQINVASEFINSIQRINMPKFPCDEHKNRVMPLIIYNFLQCRMKTHCVKLKNADKENLHLKKWSKLVKS